MVDIIFCTDFVLKMHIIVNGSDNIFLCNVLRNQIHSVAADLLFQLVTAQALFEDAFQYRIEYFFCDTSLCRVKVHIGSQVYHQVGENFYSSSFLCLKPYIRYSSVLDCDRLFLCHCLACFCKDLAGCCINNILCKNMTNDTVLKVKFLVEFISSDFRKIISSCVEEHAV